MKGLVSKMMLFSLFIIFIIVVLFENQYVGMQFLIYYCYFLFFLGLIGLALFVYSIVLREVSYYVLFYSLIHIIFSVAYPFNVLSGLH